MSHSQYGTYPSSPQDRTSTTRIEQKIKKIRNDAEGFRGDCIVMRVMVQGFDLFHLSSNVMRTVITDVPSRYHKNIKNIQDKDGCQNKNFTQSCDPVECSRIFQFFVLEKRVLGPIDYVQ